MGTIGTIRRPVFVFFGIVIRCFSKSTCFQVSGVISCGIRSPANRASTNAAFACKDPSLSRTNCAFSTDTWCCRVLSTLARMFTEANGFCVSSLESTASCKTCLVRSTIFFAWALANVASILIAKCLTSEIVISLINRSPKCSMACFLAVLNPFLLLSAKSARLET